MAGWQSLSHRLDADRQQDLFRQLDWQLGLLLPPNSEPINISVCGGAAMCYQILERGTGDVDIMFPPITPELRQAAKTIATRRGLENDWLNDGPAQFADYSQHVASVFIYKGQYITVKSPSNKYLLGMKLHAARADDIEDVQWLIFDTKIDTAKDLHNIAAQVSISIGKEWKPTSAQKAFIKARVREYKHQIKQGKRKEKKAKRKNSANSTTSPDNSKHTLPLARCRHVGIVSKKQCIRLTNHRGQHKYR